MPLEIYRYLGVWLPNILATHQESDRECYQKNIKGHQQTLSIDFRLQEETQWKSEYQ